MPTPGTAKWPKPKSEDEFEVIVLDALKIRWGNPNATRNGRRGQRQNGVDIFGKARHLGEATVGAQCKNTESPTLRQVLAEVAEAVSFKPLLAEFLFVTAADRDARLQEQVRVHFERSPAPFPVIVVFWEDVIHEISGRSELIEKHWPGWTASLAERTPTSAAAGWSLPAPCGVTRSGVPPEQYAESGFEVAVGPGDGRLDIEAAEVLPELRRTAASWQQVHALMNSPWSEGRGEFGWRLTDHPYSNVSRRWEMELDDGPTIVLRHAEFCTSDDYLPVRSSVLVEHATVATAVYARTLAACTAGGGAAVRRLTLRVSAFGSGRLFLQDVEKLAAGAPLLFHAESDPRWSSEVAIADSTDPAQIAVALERMIGRVFGKFRSADGRSVVEPDLVAVRRCIAGILAP